MSRRGCLAREVRERIEHTGPYVHDLRDRWWPRKAAHLAIPRPLHGREPS